MWITSDVNLPQEVLDAQADSSLVMFVGAGASIDAPSGLPLFDKLARQLAEKAQRPFIENMALDSFIGSMPEAFDTHRHTVDIIAREDSEPNATHTALVRVASSVGQMRIVTTNFDVHLSSAAYASGQAVPDTWVGPALPLGDSFTGIVHLHGSILRSPQELVLTDKDFGRAYLTNAWATRFLLPMFQKFTVLFIGYSHEDPIMRYLSLGLPAQTPRYAFTSTDDASNPKWSRFGVKTIDYPVQNHDHSALVGALQAWDLRVRMGQTEHRARMTEIVNGGPTLTPVDYDYLIGRLQSTDGAHDFGREVNTCELSQKISWLLWAEHLPAVKGAFAGKESDAAATVLLRWFCDSFIALPELHGAALQTAQRLGQTFAAGLFQAAGWASEALASQDAVAARRWKAFLATSIHGHSAPVSLDTILPYSPTDEPEDPTVLRAALRPYLVLKRRFTFGNSEDSTTFPDAEVQWKADADSLTEHIMKAIESKAHRGAALGKMMEDSLSTAYELLDAYYGQRSWDPMSYGRRAIEPHEQDQFREPIDAVIDGLRAYGEKALPTQIGLPESWWLIDRPLFRRLSLHLIAVDQSRTADEKILWLLDRSVLYVEHLKHEAYRVMEASASNASKETQALLLVTVQAGPRLSEVAPDIKRHIEYSIYNQLVWLSRVAPEWSEAIAALAASQTANPDFGPRVHPDIDSWTTSGTWGGKLPMEPKDFVASFEKNHIGTISELLSRDYSTRNFDSPRWTDLLSLVSRVSEAEPKIGEKLWRVVNDHSEFTEHADDLYRSIIGGWTKANLGAIADAAVALVATQVKKVGFARSISQFLVEQVGHQFEDDVTPALIAMRGIARSLWLEHGQSFDNADGTEFTWPGDLTQYWIGEVSRRWRERRDEWSGLSDDERGALIELLDDNPHARDVIRSEMANQLFFLFSADEDFTIEHVLPQFHDDSTSASAWRSYLRNPRYNDKLLMAGLLDSTLKEWDRLEALGDTRLQLHFIGIAASIVSFAGIPPLARKAMLGKSVITNEGAYEEEFAHAVGRLLRDIGVNSTEMWNSWIRDHLTARLDGLPRNMSTEAQEAWADIVPYLGDGIPDAITLLSDQNIGIDGQHFRADIPEHALSAYSQVLVLYFANRIRHTSSNSHFTRYKIKKLIELFRVALGESGVKPLVSAATERGLLHGRLDS